MRWRGDIECAWLSASVGLSGMYVPRRVKESLHVRASQAQRGNADFTRHLEANIEMLAVTLHVVSGRI